MSRKTLLVPLLVAAVTTAGPALAVPPLVEPAEISAAEAPASPPPVEVLRAWDARRADAWARGDLATLASLYTPGSVAGRHDVAMLRSWSARGLVVQRLGTQLLTVEEVAHTRSTWRLRVTDRLVGGVAEGRGVRRPLPVDGATTRVVELRRLHGRWLVASVSSS